MKPKSKRSITSLHTVMVKPPPGTTPPLWAVCHQTTEHRGWHHDKEPDDEPPDIQLERPSSWMLWPSSWLDVVQQNTHPGVCRIVQVRLPPAGIHQLQTCAVKPRLHLAVASCGGLFSPDKPALQDLQALFNLFFRRLSDRRSAGDLTKFIVDHAVRCARAS